MSNSLFTYDPQEVVVSLFGITINGLVAEDSIIIEPLTNSSDKDSAIDGSGTIYLDQFVSYKVTIKLSQASESNSLFDILYRLLKRCGGNLRMPLIVRDKNSGSVFTSLDTFFVGKPQATYGGKPQPFSWEFKCENPTYSLSGYDEGVLYKSLELILNMVDTAETLGFDLSTISDKITKSAEGIMSKIDDLL